MASRPTGAREHPSLVEGKSTVWDEIEQLERNEGLGELSEKHSKIGGAKAVK